MYISTVIYRLNTDNGVNNTLMVNAVSAPSVEMVCCGCMRYGAI